MTFAQFVAECVRRQLDTIRRERMRMRKADALFLQYAAAMGKLGLHPLTPNEIGDRMRQLNEMQGTVHETHGATETMRAIYEGRFAGRAKRKAAS